MCSSKQKTCRKTCQNHPLAQHKFIYHVSRYHIVATQKADEISFVSGYLSRTYPKPDYVGLLGKGSGDIISILIVSPHLELAYVLYPVFGCAMSSHHSGERHPSRQSLYNDAFSTELARTKALIKSSKTIIPP